MFKSIRNAFVGWKAYNQTVRELSALTNRDLHDLGIVRSDIRDLARKQANVF